ncbi:MAG: PQQ-binding-like beta-propeller repeat protein, partial [Candidatus Poseidonia sp.]|nr:PQQ-binding-like beta-propeller repeat protein [Poseidonia sp.]
MRRHALLCIAFLTLLSATTVQGATPVWSLDVGPGYITTSPVVDEDRVYLRTSGFWTGEERPEVMAIDAQGRVVWTRVNSNTTQHDMAPLILVPPGTGPCGAWPEFLLVGWADGTLEALDTDDGRVLWSLSTFVDGWGITGRAAVDGDHAVVPLRNGLVRLCLSNAAIDFQSQLDLGWRNGVTVTEDGFWMGDEAGHLWHVARNGEATSPVSLPGSLRHPPVHVGDTLLLHAQTSSASRLFSFHPSNGSLVELAVLGP